MMNLRIHKKRAVRFLSVAVLLGTGAFVASGNDLVNAAVKKKGENIQSFIKPRMPLGIVQRHLVRSWSLMIKGKLLTERCREEGGPL